MLMFAERSPSGPSGAASASFLFGAAFAGYIPSEYRVDSAGIGGAYIFSLSDAIGFEQTKKGLLPKGDKAVLDDGLFLGESVPKENSGGGGMTNELKLLGASTRAAGGELEGRDVGFSGDSPLGSE
jgi:hypothetical protein